MHQHTLSIDIETYSSVDIKKSGMYKYVQSPDFEILLFAYVYDSQPVIVKDLTKQPMPDHFIDTLLSPDVIKCAYNAAFEWYCLSKYLSSLVPGFDSIAWLSQWRCTMLHGLYCGFPAGLSAVGDALGLPQDKRKLGVGMSLIRTFCIPQKPTKTNGGRLRILPHHEPEKWELFKTYCAQDVTTEMAVNEKLRAWPVPAEEQHLWELDQAINARGVAIDTDLVSGAIAISEIVTGQLMDEARKISGLDNPKSVKQLLDWVNTEMSEVEDLADLQKKTVKDLLKREDIDSPDARRILEIRQELGKTSVTKYAAMQAAVCDDGRVRGLLQFYGANRTGRWAGRLVQVQNLPRNYLDSLDLARDLVKQQRIDDLKWIYGTVPDTLSQLIRTAFVPAPGKVYVVADFSAIEARVIAWLAGETWRQEVFATHGKIYEASASTMFSVPIDKIKKGNPEYALRQKGKIAELALGYQGGKGALITMGALTMGLTEEELPDIVTRWRQSNKRIVDLWYKFDSAAIEAVSTGHAVIADHGVTFACEYDRTSGLDFLTIQLPSGRKLYYASPKRTKNQWGGDSISYRGTDQKTKKWGTLETYGGKLVENVVQAIARDCLAVAMERLESAGYPIVMHVHDEAIIEYADPTMGQFEKACDIMGIPIDWAPGLLLRADGFTTPYYKKD